jgi:hypothetical protein
MIPNMPSTVGMMLFQKARLAAVLIVATVPVALAWEDTPRLNIYQLAYPVE